MDLSRLSNGERISGVSAILLFVFMFFHWFGVKAINTSNLLFAIQSVEPGKSAWEALDYTPIVLLITIVATLAGVALRLENAVRGPSISVDAVVAILGIVSMLLILFRIVDPPVFSVGNNHHDRRGGPIADLPRSIGRRGGRLRWLLGDVGGTRRPP